MPYNPHGNSTCERLNHMFHNLLLTFDKEQKSNWPLHVPSVVFAYNAMPHSVPGYQSYELMFGQEAPSVCNSWLGPVKYNDQYPQRKCAWLNEQHELILDANKQALKTLSKLPKRSGPCRRYHSLYPSLVLLRDHPKNRNKIKDNYKSELFIIVSKLKDPTV